MDLVKQLLFYCKWRWSSTLFKEYLSPSFVMVGFLEFPSLELNGYIFLRAFVMCKGFFHIEVWLLF
jgi:hypothetical protein